MGKPDIIVGSPPEFKGKPDNWAPEELLVGSVNTCILLTFLTLAQGRGLIPAAYDSAAEGLLENVDGKYLITEVTVRPRITVKSRADTSAPPLHRLADTRAQYFWIQARRTR
jgi:organic hydroperoxide reductase OsmC/OhrA